MNETIELITYDANGNRLYRQIYAEEQDTYGDEFARAGQSGIRATKIFIVHINEYSNEDALRHRGTIYSIYRIGKSTSNAAGSRKGKRELYCEVRIGDS